MHIRKFTFWISAQISCLSPFCKSIPQISPCFALAEMDGNACMISLASPDGQSVDRAADMVNHPTDHDGPAVKKRQKRQQTVCLLG